jgi:hypothetical protein
MMKFADTFYFMALLNRKDSSHAAAMEHSQGPGRILTTEWVLTELADAMASQVKRQSFVDLYGLLRSDSQVEVIPSSPDLFSLGIDLYSARPDKDWSLTDCISFVAMQQRGITDVLTGDHHFEQAGFRPLLT